MGSCPALPAVARVPPQEEKSRTPGGQVPVDSGGSAGISRKSQQAYSISEGEIETLIRVSPDLSPVVGWALPKSVTGGIASLLKLLFAFGLRPIRQPSLWPQEYSFPSSST